MKGGWIWSQFCDANERNKVETENSPEKSVSEYKDTRMERSYPNEDVIGNVESALNSEKEGYEGNVVVEWQKAKDTVWIFKSKKEEGGGKGKGEGKEKEALG